MDENLKRLVEEKKKLQGQLAYIEIVLATQPTLQEESGSGFSSFTIYRNGVIVRRDKLKDELRDIDLDIARIEERARGVGAKGVKPIILQNVKAECEKRKLPKDVTINPDTKYDVALAVGIKQMPSRKKFKAGNAAYQQISKYMSELGYKRRKATKY
jgi:hypothetical protein